MIVYRVNLFLLIVFLFVQIQDATPRGDSTSSIRSPNPLISYRFDEEDNIDKNDDADTSHTNSHEDIESDEKSKERSFQNPSRRRPTRFRDATLSSTTSIRSPTNRLIAYRLDEGENFDKNDYGGKSRTSSHSRKNRRRHEDYYDDVEDEKKSGEKSTENQETSTESQEISTHLLVASQETTIRSPTHRLISYRLEESDHTPTHQFQKAKKAAYDFNLSRRVKRATKKVEETRTRKKDFVDDDDDDLYSYYQWRLRRARLLRRLRELDAESLRPTPTCCRSYRNPRYYPSYYQQPYYGRSPYYSYPSYGTYYPSYGGYGGYGGYRPLGGYGGYPPQALDLGIGWGVNVGVPAAGLGVGVNSGLGVTVG